MISRGELVAYAIVYLVLGVMFVKATRADRARDRLIDEERRRS